VVSKIFKKTLFFCSVCIFGFTINIISQTASEAADALASCAKNADGQILVTVAGLAGTQFKTGTEKAPFNYANGHIDAEFSANETDACSQEPDFYKVKFYKAMLCVEDPYQTDANPDFTSCAEIFKNAAGKDVILKPGESSDLLEGDLILPAGEYYYAAMVISNHLKVKHMQEYALVGGGALDLYGNGDTAGGNTGTDVCYSVATITTYSGNTDLTDGSATANAYNASQGLANGTIKESGASSTLARLECVDSVANAIAAGDWDYQGEIFDHMGGDDDQDFVASYPNLVEQPAGGYIDSSGETGVTGIEMAGLMMKEDNLTVATERTNAKRMGMFFKYTNPIKVNENTIGMRLFFTTYSSVSIDFSQDDEAGKNIWGVKMGADPFTVQFKTKTKRRTRAWR
jgi:hypothetical protein